MPKLRDLILPDFEDDDDSERTTLIEPDVASASSSSSPRGPLVSPRTLAYGADLESCHHESLGQRKSYRGGLASGMVVFVAAICIWRMSSRAEPQPESVSARPADERLFDFRACRSYGGMYDPLGAVCCRPECGKYCGAIDCEMGPGGAAACCTKQVTRQCGFGVKIPCRLAHGSKFIPKTDRCGKYGGIDHPFERNRCCQTKCGALCGAAPHNCEKAGADYTECCKYRETSKCELTGMAPCITGTLTAGKECAIYGGHVHPSATKCCASECGKRCGNHDCWKVLKDPIASALACCRNSTGLPHCSRLSGVPCSLKHPKDEPPDDLQVFGGMMTLKFDSRTPFVDNTTTRMMCQRSLAQAAQVQAGEVLVKDVDQHVADHVETVGVQFEVVIPRRSAVTDASLTGVLTVKALSDYMNLNGLTHWAPAAVTSVFMFTTTTTTTMQGIEIWSRQK